jgi:hypothetical protein
MISPELTSSTISSALSGDGGSAVIDTGGGVPALKAGSQAATSRSQSLPSS